MGSTGAYNMLRRMTQSSISYKFQSIVPPPIPSRSDSRHNSTFSYFSESGGHVKWDDFPVKRVDSKDLEEYIDDDDIDHDRKKQFIPTVLEYIKILIPHVGLNILTLSYLMIGTLVFIYLEAENDLKGKKEKFYQVRNIYKMIMTEAVAICRSEGTVKESTIERRMRPLLSILSRTHEYDDRLTRDAQMWSDNVDNLPTKWTFAASTLYALTVITCCGYDHVTPITDAGKIFTIIYGLLGIPLMFITAADIGKFLSGLVIQFYGKMRALLTWSASVVDAMRDYILGSDADSIDSRKLRKQRRSRRRHNGDDDDEGEDEEERLPIVSYIMLVIGYCIIGSVLFNAWEKGAIWSFIHGVFFSYNTITTIVLGNIRVRNDIYLALAVSYIIIGLAVITASLDLCSSTIKRIFNKLHYFGRRIRGARQGLAGVSEDIREAMKIMAALKKTRPGKDRITLDDLRHFLEVQEQLLRQPYVPYNIQIFKWIEDAYAQYFEDIGKPIVMEKNNFKYFDADESMLSGKFKAIGECELSLGYLLRR